MELFYHCSPIQDIMATLTEWFILVKLMLNESVMYQGKKAQLGFP
jgi:hypothetical protein